MLSHTEKLFLDSSTVITLLNWLDEDGFANFAFYAITGKNLQNFSAALKTGPTDPEKYGYIIKHGYAYPEVDDWRFMKDKYGIEQDKIAVLELPKK